GQEGGGSASSGTMATALVGSSGSRITCSRSDLPGGSPGTDATMTGSSTGGAKTACSPLATPVATAPSAESWRQRSKVRGSSGAAPFASSLPVASDVSTGSSWLCLSG